LNPDSYLPEESFDALVGSTLNGIWTLTIIDNITGDNGTLFSWGVNFFNYEMGCTDPTALNYNQSATEDDNSCEYTACQTIDFPSGWFIFSTHIESEIVDLEEVLNPIIESIVIVKNNVGLAYLPDYNYNGIGDITNHEGFQIKTYNDVSLEICGTQISPENNPLTLESGWNLISYTREEPADVVSVVASLTVNNNLVIFKDYLGMAYLPEYDYNGIGDMTPTHGYQLKVNEAAVLEFLSNGETY